MKAVLQSYKGGDLQVVEVPPPALQPGGVLVGNVVSLVSAGTERLLVELAQKSLVGKARARPDLVEQVLRKIRRDGLLATLETVGHRLNTPVPLGYSASGQVIAVGREVTGIERGDRVACGGTGYALHAEVIYVPRNLVVKLPVGVDYEAGAFTTVGSVALQALRLARPQLGETLVVIGLGLIGLITVQLARASGCTVLGMDPDRRRCELAEKLGAVGAVSRADELLSLGSSRTSGRGADAVILAASTKSSEPVRLAGDVARSRGRVVALGAVGLELPRKPYYEKELDFVISRSYGPGRYDPNYEEKGRDYPAGYVRWTENRNMEAFVEQLARWHVVVEPLITHRFPVEEAGRAYDLLAGKVDEPSLGILLTYTYPRGEVATPSVGRTRIEYRTTESASRTASFTLGIGAVGAGQFGSGVLLPALAKLDGVEMRGVCTASGAQAGHVARKFDFRYATTDEDEILRDPVVTAVVIATRHHLHARQVLASLRAGKHVFVEKPLCLTEEELSEIETLYRELDEGGKAPLLMVGYNRRFAPMARRLKEMMAGLDEPLVMHIRVNAGRLPHDHWVQDPDQGGGRILGEVCHFVDFLVFLSGSLPVRVHAAALPGVGPEGRDNLAATIEHANGSIGTITYVAGGASGLSKERVEVLGGGRSAVLDNFRRLELYRGDRRSVSRARLRQDKGHRGEMAAFVDAVRRGGPTPISPDELFAVTRCTLAMVECLKTRSPIDI